jgi:hypothetical protein
MAHSFNSSSLSFIILLSNFLPIIKLWTIFIGFGINKKINNHKDIQKHKGGRPKIDENQRKKEKVFMSFTVKEKEKLKQYADENGMLLATFIRKMLKDNREI